MDRSTYLFRMFPHELECLNALSVRYRGKREALCAALLALERQEKERMAETMETRTSILARLEALEAKVAALGPSSAKPGARSAASIRRQKPDVP